MVSLRWAGPTLAMDERAFFRVALISGVIVSSTEGGREIDI